MKNQEQVIEAKRMQFACFRAFAVAKGMTKAEFNDAVKINAHRQASLECSDVVPNDYLNAARWMCIARGMTDAAYIYMMRECLYACGIDNDPFRPIMRWERPVPNPFRRLR